MKTSHKSLVARSAAGDVEATYRLGNHRYFGTRGYTENKIAGIQHWTSAARKGHAKASYQLGVHLRDNASGCQAEATKRFQEAHEGGLAEGSYEFARRLLHGIGCQKNTRKAAEIALPMLGARLLCKKGGKQS